MHKEFEEIQKEVEEEVEKEELTERKKERSGPLKFILGVFLVLLIILMIIPHYAVKIDKEPGVVNKIDLDIDMENISTQRVESIYDIGEFEVTPTTRQAALQITNSCTDTGNSELCYAKALFYYVRDHVRYIKDPEYEYIQSAEETLLGAGDCEDQAIALMMLVKSIGIKSRLVLIPGHAYTEIFLEEAPEKYKGNGKWIELDPTCSQCGFGEIHYQSENKMRNYVEV